MGKLSDALKANKLLRKQFNTPKAKPLSKKAQELQDYTYNESNFGCNTEAAARSFSIILGENISKKNNGNEFTPIEGAILKYVKGRLTGQTEASKGILIEDDGVKDCLHWIDKNGGICDYHRSKEKFIPATDAEIKKFFS